MNSIPLASSLSALKRFLARLYEAYSLKIRFILVGAWNTLFGYLIFCALDSLFTPLFHARQAAYMSASVVGTVISILNAYVSHKKVTFKSGVRGMRIIGEFLRFSTTYAVTFCIGLVLLPLLVEVGGIHPKISAGLITLGCTIVSYIGHSRYSFKTR